MGRMTMFCGLLIGHVLHLYIKQKWIISLDNLAQNVSFIGDNLKLNWTTVGLVLDYLLHLMDVL